MQSLAATIEELGNLFLEESIDLIVLDTKEIANQCSVKTVQNAHEVGKKQFDNFIRESLIDRSKHIGDVISRNKFPLFVKSGTKVRSKQRITSMKGELEFFSRMCIACQTRDGKVDDFFVMRTQLGHLHYLRKVPSTLVVKVIY